MQKQEKWFATAGFITFVSGIVFYLLYIAIAFWGLR